jgi:hypothetical protein
MGFGRLKDIGLIDCTLIHYVFKNFYLIWRDIVGIQSAGN